MNPSNNALNITGGCIRLVRNYFKGKTKQFVIWKVNTISVTPASISSKSPCIRIYDYIYIYIYTGPGANG